MSKKVNGDELVNWWLEKYHNTNLTKVLEDNPEWVVNPQDHTRDFYKKYAVTQEQHDEWEIWAKKYVKQITKANKKVLEVGWAWVYLDTSPSVIKDDNT